MINILPQLFLATLLGILAGTLTGLIPGIHTNLVAVLILTTIASSTILIPSLSPITLAIFIVSMAITHTFVDFLPSIYLGAPDEDTALSILPGHKFLLKGHGHQAVLLTVLGSSIAIILLFILTPILIPTLPKIYPLVQRMMSWILIWVSLFLISKEKRIFWPIIIFLLAGFLGIATLNNNVNQPLLPLLTGLFGASTLIHSINSNQQIPKQKISKLLINKKQLLKPTLLTFFISPICSILPGMGSSQAAIIGSQITKINSKQFLILVGSINTLVLGISFVTLYTISKARTGAANAIAQLIELSASNLYIILLTILLSSVAAIFITIKLSKIFAKNITKINYLKISKLTLLTIFIITILISHFTGLLILITSTSLGLLAIKTGTRKNLLMGCLLIPTIIYYFPF